MQYRRAPGKTKVTTEAPGIFQRTMQWRNKRDSKIKKLRQQKVEQEGPSSLAFDSNYKEATVGEHLDAYHRYNMLVGEADGGVALPEAQYKKLEKRCAEAAKDRLFCTWRNKRTKMDCVNVGPMTRCFCGHSYRAHAFYRNQSKKVHCRVPNCKCDLFQYVYHRGGRAVKCQCKHDLQLHRDKSNRSVPCKHPRGCNCTCFVPTVTCTCEEPATMHETVFERRSEREGDQRLTKALWNEMETTGGGNDNSAQHLGAGRDVARANRAMAAGAGGLTSYLSLAPGMDRVKIDPSSALPYDALRDDVEQEQFRQLQVLNDDMSDLRLRERHQLLEQQLHEQDLRHSYSDDTEEERYQPLPHQDPHQDPHQEPYQEPYQEQSQPPQRDLSPLSKHMAEQAPSYVMPDVETDMANASEYGEYVEEEYYEEQPNGQPHVQTDQYSLPQQHEQNLSPLSKHVAMNAHKHVAQRQQPQQRQQQQPNQRRARPRPVPKRTGQTVGKRYQQRTVNKVAQPAAARRKGAPSLDTNNRKYAANGGTQTNGRSQTNKEQPTNRRSKKPIPSYMRSTKAMNMWKKQTADVKKMSKSERVKQIY